MSAETQSPSWRDQLDEKQQKEVRFAEVYAEQFAHGAVGHNQMILIAKLALLLDVTEGAKVLPPPPPPGEMRVTFGRHSGKTLQDILLIDIGYVEWLAKEAHEQEMRKAARALLAQAEMLADYEREEPEDSEEVPF